MNRKALLQNINISYAWTALASDIPLITVSPRGAFHGYMYMFSCIGNGDMSFCA